MPKRLLNVISDLPGLPPMQDEEATQFAQLIEPLQPPKSARNVAWVCHNLHLALKQLANTPGCSSNKWLVSMLARTASAWQTLNGPPEPPEVTFFGEVTLWVCLEALSPHEPDLRLHKLAGAVYVQMATGGKPPSDAFMSALFKAAMTSKRGQYGDQDAHIISVQIVGQRMLNSVLIHLRTPALSHQSAASSMTEAKVEKAMRGAYRFDNAHQEDGTPRVRGLTACDVRETAEAVRRGAERGSGELLLVATAHWLGVSPVDMAEIEVFAPNPGLMRIDSTCSYVEIRLEGILTELARAEMPSVLRSGDRLIHPLPGWIAMLLRGLRALVRIPAIADSHSKLIADSVPRDRGHRG
jgi:hypothetical protein